MIEGVSVVPTGLGLTGSMFSQDCVLGYSRTVPTGLRTERNGGPDQGPGPGLLNIKVLKAFRALRWKNESNALCRELGGT